MVRNTKWNALVITVLAVVASLMATSVPAAALVPTTPDSGLWQVNGRVRKILQTDSAIYVAGLFTALIAPDGHTVARQNVAALNPLTGEPLPFNPNANKAVWTMALSPDGSRVYLGGDFTSVGGQPRKRAAAVDATTGDVQSWNPGADGQVTAILPLGSSVYLGGEFLTVGAVPQPHLAAVSSTAATRVPGWTATSDQVVHDLVAAPDGATVLAGGAFTSISGVTQRFIAALDPATGAVKPWASHPTFQIFDLEIAGQQVFAAGGGSGGHAMAYDRLTGQQQWSGFGDGDAVAVQLQNGVLYVGGHFTQWQGVGASHIVALNPSTGARISWGFTVNSNLGIFAVDSHAGHLAIGGDFTRINTRALQHLARFTETADTQAPTIPGRPSGTATSSIAINLTWAASTDNTATSLAYDVYRNGGSAPVGEVTSSSTSTVSFHDTGLAPGQSYTYQVTASDGANVSALSPVSAPVTTLTSDAPVLESLQMYDNNTNGHADHIRAVFSGPVTCTAPCLSPWTLSAFPTGMTLQAVSVASSAVTLTLAEGTAPAKTDVGGAKVSLTASPAGVLGGTGHSASFPATSPDDKMAPVPVDLTSSNSGLDNVMEPGDTFTVTFSEPIDPTSVIAANVKQLDPPGPGNDGMIVVGLSDGPIDLGSDDYVLPDGGTIVYQKSTLTMLDSGRKIRSTIVGGCTGTACGLNGPGFVGIVTFRPEPFLRDLAGNVATGERVETEGVF